MISHGPHQAPPPFAHDVTHRAGRQHFTRTQSLVGFGFIAGVFVGLALATLIGVY